MLFEAICKSGKRYKRKSKLGRKDPKWNKQKRAAGRASAEKAKASGWATIKRTWATQ